MSFKIRPIEAADKAWITALLQEHWAGPMMVTRGKTHYVDTYPGFTAVEGDEPVGLVTYYIDGQECEITSLNSLAEGKGVGSTLVDAVKKAALAQKCRRLRLVTTNDNTRALRFWQNRGFTIMAVRFNALEETRRLKPGIPLTNEEGIPIRDEIELEMTLY